MPVSVMQRHIGLRFEGRLAIATLWAPLAKQVALIIPDASSSALALNLCGGEGAYWELRTNILRPGSRYRFKIDENDSIPDPASVFQPEGVHGASEAVDLDAYTWKDAAWRNPFLADYIIYEFHAGLFTAEGTLDAACSRLEYLTGLGITAVEIMPVAQFPGSRNWGYDGVFPFAVQDSYGGPAALMRFVDACHKHGLAVILDVVYNHLGPEGNYMSQSGPWFTARYTTPWGPAINFEDAYCDGVRQYYIENALMWLRDFHIDALRLDAVHAIKDTSAINFLEELKLTVEALGAATKKNYYLIVECDLNDPRYIKPVSQGGYGMDAQWSDEFHHALRVSAGLSRSGYYEDFTGVRDLAKVLTQAYVYTGEYSAHRKRKFGKRVKPLSGSQFIVFSQNHDQVGNRMLGERSITIHGPALAKVLAAAVLLSPFIPLLFMGEEYGETTPFQYFVSHGDPELNRVVREGRKAEFKAFHLDQEVPDPGAEVTFNRSRPGYTITAGNSEAQSMFDWYKLLITLRKTEAVLRCGPMNVQIEQAEPHSGLLWFSRSSAAEKIHCFLNFGSEDRPAKLAASAVQPKIIADSTQNIPFQAGISRKELTIKAFSALVLKEG